jgi:hypothetical protein
LTDEIEAHFLSGSPFQAFHLTRTEAALAFQALQSLANCPLHQYRRHVPFKKLTVVITGALISALAASSRCWLNRIPFSFF